MLSCEEAPVQQPEYPDFTPDDLYKLHHHIRPTKPIRIPDTMAIKMRTAILETPSDTITTHPQDSLP
jgi:hypothetical protein